MGNINFALSETQGNINVIDEIYQAIHNTKEKPPYTTSVKGQLLKYSTTIIEDALYEAQSAFIKYQQNWPLVFNKIYIPPVVD